MNKNTLNLSERIFQKMSDCWLRVCVALVGMFTSLFAFAGTPVIGGDDLGEVAQKLKGETTSGIALLWVASQAIGIAAAIVGINMWVKASKHMNERFSKGQCVMIVLGGSFLFFLPEVMGVGASSFFTN